MSPKNVLPLLLFDIIKTFCDVPFNSGMKLSIFFALNCSNSFSSGAIFSLTKSISSNFFSPFLFVDLLTKRRKNDKLLL